MGLTLTGDGSDSPAEEPFDLTASVERLVRGGWDELESSVVIHPDPCAVDQTRATVHTHFLRSDPNGRPRLDALAQQLADQLVHYCIPRSKLAEVQALPPDRQLPATLRLGREATALFTQTQVQTGEGSELLLYALLEKRLNIPQVLSKMSLKTSREMQIHGADGVHARFLENGDLALYWGEAKMYDSVADAMTSCLDSLAPYLTGSAHEQDVFLIQHYADTGTEELTARLLEYFDDGSLRSADVEMRGACLIGFSLENYPRLPRELETVREEVEATAQGWVTSMGTRLKNRHLEGFVIEVFLVPVPSADEFRAAIKKALHLEAS